MSSLAQVADLAGVRRRKQAAGLVIFEPAGYQNGYQIVDEDSPPTVPLFCRSGAR